MLRLDVRERQRLDRMNARREREKRHPHRLARSRSQRPVVSEVNKTVVSGRENGENNGRKATDAPYTDAALQRHDPRSRARPSSYTSSMRVALPPTPTLPHAHLEPPRPHALIKHKHVQRKFIMRHQSSRTSIGTAVHANTHDDALTLWNSRRGRGWPMRV